MKNNINFDKVYKKLFNNYKRMVDIGIYKKIGAEDVIQDAVISFLNKNPDLSKFESNDHLYHSLRYFLFNRKKSITANKRCYRLSKDVAHLSIEQEPISYKIGDYFIPTNLEDIDVANTVYLKCYLRGFTQKEIASKNNVSQMTVSRKLRNEIVSLL